jgi:hypothetical protein
MKTLYLLLAIVGLVLPYYFLAAFLVEHGLDLALLVQQLFANRISTFFAVDLIISSAVFWVFVYQESARRQVPHAWVFVATNLLVGLSFALPLFLYVRQSRIEGNRR